MKLSLIALVCLVACSAPPEFAGRQPTVFVDEDFGPRIVDVVAGIRGWPVEPHFILERHSDVLEQEKRHEPGTVYMLATPGYRDCPLEIIPDSCAEELSFEGGSGTACLDMVQIEAGPENETRRTSAHEFGHALGIGHLPEPSVMQSTFSGPDAPTPIDLAALQ